MLQLDPVEPDRDQLEACRRRAPRPRSSSPGSRPGTATARRARRPRSPRGCRPSRRPARSGPRRGAGGGPARGSGPRRPAAARSCRGTAPCSAGTSGACRSCGSRVVVQPAGRRARGRPARRHLEFVPHDPAHRPARRATPADYRAVVPRADVRRRGRRSRSCARSARPSARAGVEAIREFSERFDGVAPERHAGARGRPSTEALAELDPAVRAGLEESIAPAARVPARPSSSTDVTTDARRRARRVTQRMVPVRPGRPLRRPAASRRWSPACVMNVVPAQVAGVASIALASPPQQGPRRPAAPDDPGRLRAARRRRGVRRRRGAGDRDVRLRRRAVPPGRPGHRPRQHLHRRGQAAAQGRRRHRLRGRPDRDRDPRRRHRRRGVRRRRPGQPGRARPAWPRACWSPTRSRLADDVEAELDKQVLATRHTERIRTAPRRPAVGRSSWSTTSTRGSTSSTPTPPSTSRSRPRDAAAVAARVRNAGAIFVGAVRPGVARRLLRRLQPRAADRRLRLPLLGAVGAGVPQGRPRRRLRRATRSPRSPTTSSRSPRPRTCPATARPSGSGSDR